MRYNIKCRCWIGCWARDMLSFYEEQSSKLLWLFMEMRYGNGEQSIRNVETVSLEFCARCLFPGRCQPSGLCFNALDCLPFPWFSDVKWHAYFCCLGRERRGFNTWWDYYHHWGTWIDCKDCKRCHDSHIKCIFPRSGFKSWFVGFWIHFLFSSSCYSVF